MPCGLGVHWDVKGRRWHFYSPMCCRRSTNYRNFKTLQGAICGSRSLWIRFGRVNPIGFVEIVRVFVGKNREQSWIKYAGDDR
jgi:hypothetical protein